MNKVITYCLLLCTPAPSVSSQYAQIKTFHVSFFCSFWLSSTLDTLADYLKSSPTLTCKIITVIKCWKSCSFKIWGAMLKIWGFLQKNAFIHHFLRKCNLCLWGTVHCIQLLWFIVYVPCLLLWYHSAANIFKLHVIWSNILKKLRFCVFSACLMQIKESRLNKNCSITLVKNFTFHHPSTFLTTA